MSNIPRRKKFRNRGKRKEFLKAFSKEHTHRLGELVVRKMQSDALQEALKCSGIWKLNYK